MKYYIQIFLSCVFLNLTATGQPKGNCFEIKYLDFFGIEELDTLKWPASELDQLLITDFTEDEIDRNKKTNFLIPYIVLQLKDYYPACSNNTDTSTFRKLKQLYYKIRQQDISTLNSKTVSTQLEIIRQDFYLQVLNDSLLPFMGFTLDDGPFYGEISKYIPDYKKGSSYSTEFGTLFITKYSGKIFITVLDNQGTHLWTRIMTGNHDRYLTQISFSEESIFKTSLGYRLSMGSEGEALNLYLKSNGEFRYYFHSW